MKYYCENCGSEFEQGGYIPAKDSLVVMNWDCPNCDGGKLNMPLPARETVAQWEARKGREYSDTAPIYGKYKNDPAYGWELEEYLNSDCYDYVVVATEDGAPPDDWRPEE